MQPQFWMRASVLFQAHLIITQKATRWEGIAASFDAHLANQHFFRVEKSNYLYHHAVQDAAVRTQSDSAATGVVHLFSPSRRKHETKAKPPRRMEKQGNPLIANHACCCCSVCKLHHSDSVVAAIHIALYTSDPLQKASQRAAA